MIISRIDFKPPYAFARFLGRHNVTRLGETKFHRRGETFEQFKENFMTYAIMEIINEYPDYFKKESDKKKREEMARNIATNLIKKIEETPSEESIPQ